MKRVPWCGRCGSRNHSAFDCNKPGTYQPTPGELAEIAEPLPPPPPPPEPVFEPGERFRGCRPICTAANLPAFPDQASCTAAAKKDHGGGGYLVRKLWNCKACGSWHADISAERTGTNGRSLSRYPEGFKEPFVRRSSRDLMLRVHSHGDQGPDLPRDETVVAVAEPPKDAVRKKKVDSAKAKPQTKGREGELF